MPNWVRNKVRCERMDLIKEMYLSDEGSFTFNKVIPMPDWVEQTSIPSSGGAEGCDWYDWSRRHWGTKWDANVPLFQEEFGEEILVFDTAWSMPEPVFREMAWQLGSTIEVEYADEEWGCNAGAVSFHADGSITGCQMEGDAAFSAQVWGEEYEEVEE